MPPPRKVDLLPPEIRSWLQEELKARGFGGYEELAESLNRRLAAEGLELRIRKSALNAWGQEYERFIRYQEEASAWAAGWMAEQGLEDEAKRHNVLFQMVTTLAFRVMQARMLKDGEDIDPRELHFLGRLMKDVMASSGMREKLIEDLRREQARALEDAVAQGRVDEAAARAAREAMGWT